MNKEGGTVPFSLLCCKYLHNHRSESVSTVVKLRMLAVGRPSRPFTHRAEGILKKSGMPPVKLLLEASREVNLILV